MIDKQFKVATNSAQENRGSRAKVSVVVIIVNWNSGNWLKRCLRGVAAQTLQPQRVLLVDNASTDNSLDDIAGIVTDIEIIRETENSGFAKANNIALKSIEDIQWTVLLNPDAVPEPDWLENLMQAAQAYPDFNFFACKMLDAANPSKLDGAGDIFHTSGHAWRHGFGGDSILYGKTVQECFSPCAAAAMYRTDIIQQAGGFDERFFCYFEDIDLGFRLRLMGYRCLYVPEAVVAHAGSAVTGKRSDFTVYHGQRNMLWAYCKNMPGPLFWIYLPQHIVMNIVAVFVLLVRGQGLVAVRAKFDAIRMLPLVWKDRRDIQQNRKIKSIKLWRLMAKGIYSLLKRN